MARKGIAIQIIVFFSILTIAFIGYTEQKDKHSQPFSQATPCSNCHNCMQPTSDSPCLEPCPRSVKAITTHSPEEGPDVVYLDQLSDQYVPVVFAHKLHAEMAQMGHGCESCHHYSPETHIPPCKECHHGPFNPKNLRQPGLKGAYHRQCMECHVEWSHDTACIFCHARKVAGQVPVRAPDATDIVGIKHPRISEPEKKVYKTKYNGDTVVTFHHDEHVKQFDFKCVDCHHVQKCSRCHEIEEKPKQAIKTEEEHHKPCIICHSQTKCNECHRTTEMKGFSHAKTGWPLNQYHQSIKCRSCHTNMRKITRLNRECIACHGNWSPSTFKHAVTGLELDEEHMENDCAECHVERKFDEKPSCSNCHDEGTKYPQSIPGKMATATGK